MPRSDDGYTLVEALTALVIISLALAGVSQVVIVGSRQVSRIAATHEMLSDRAQVIRLVKRLPAMLGPFDGEGNGFVGGPNHARFQCGSDGVFCEVDADQGRAEVRIDGVSTAVRVRSDASLRLLYVGSDEALHTSWPPSQAAGRLRALAVMSGDAPWAVLRLPISQAHDCVFDRSSGDCTVMKGRR
ncbi:type II secretion system protein [Caulobacter endophyticus]|uniref:Prepilin-type N-terminal cleavage/methylation domain-containing protein n=1 Tax=Caulobacter endophyticus TaxID=2172652 RepID=A0A2T9JYR7_9CAUL|nr:prepilin-type N-terminal cleavage/methylation domain-containing protein [Caulobacter endophyticus]PVM88824.1 hypothetical protein DDF67_12655 [Caulobacter endophyticus]